MQSSKVIAKLSPVTFSNGVMVRYRSHRTTVASSMYERALSALDTCWMVCLACFRGTDKLSLHVIRCLASVAARTETIGKVGTIPGDPRNAIEYRVASVQMHVDAYGLLTLSTLLEMQELGRITCDVADSLRWHPEHTTNVGLSSANLLRYSLCASFLLDDASFWQSIPDARNLPRGSHNSLWHSGYHLLRHVYSALCSTRGPLSKCALALASDVVATAYWANDLAEAAACALEYGYRDPLARTSYDHIKKAIQEWERPTPGQPETYPRTVIVQYGWKHFAYLLQSGEWDVLMGPSKWVHGHVSGLGGCPLHKARCGYDGLLRQRYVCVIRGCVEEALHTCSRCSHLTMPPAGFLGGRQKAGSRSESQGHKKWKAGSRSESQTHKKWKAGSHTQNN